MNKIGMVIAAAWCTLLLVSASAHGQFPESGSSSGKSPGGYVDVTIEPERPVTGDQVRLRVKLHGGAIRAETRWEVNGEEVGIPADSDTLNQYVELDTPLKADDVVEVSVTPYDAIGEAGPTVSKRVVIGNAGPNMKLERQWLDSASYHAKIDATDPEGEPITLTLREGPEGMKIDDKGLITWHFGEGTHGTFPVEVSAKDAKGVEAILSYTFRIRWAKQQRNRQGMRRR